MSTAAATTAVAGAVVAFTAVCCAANVRTHVEGQATDHPAECRREIEGLRQKLEENERQMKAQTVEYQSLVDEAARQKRAAREASTTCQCCWTACQVRCASHPLLISPVTLAGAGSEAGRGRVTEGRQHRAQECYHTLSGVWGGSPSNSKGWNRCLI